MRVISSFRLAFLAHTLIFTPFFLYLWKGKDGKGKRRAENRMSKGKYKTDVILILSFPFSLHGVTFSFSPWYFHGFSSFLCGRERMREERGKGRKRVEESVD